MTSGSADEDFTAREHFPTGLIVAEFLENRIHSTVSLVVELPDIDELVYTAYTRGFDAGGTAPALVASRG